MKPGKVTSLTFFPTPYPDECYYSVLCRYHVRSGNEFAGSTVTELFGNCQCLTSMIYIPRRLDLFEKWFPYGVLDREKMALHHTMYPYCATHYTRKIVDEMQEVMGGKAAGTSLERQMLLKIRGLWQPYLRHCPDCMEQDMKIYGETYWHRLHQLPGVAICPKHGIRIQDSEFSTKETTYRFYPATEIRGLENRAGLYPHANEYMGEYIRIAESCQWLLNNGHFFEGCENINLKYKEVMISQGLTTVQGIIYRERLLDSICSFYEDGFLKDVTGKNGQESLSWLSYVTCSMAEHLQPLEHVLMMNFLAGSAASFYEMKIQNEPYGKPVWPCVNRHCPHYGKEGISSVRISYMNGLCIGHFRCDYCGMSFQRSNPDKKFKEYIGHVKIDEYGNLWRAKLQEYLEDEKFPMAQLHKKMYCSIKRIQIESQNLGYVYSEEIKRHRAARISGTEAERLYREQAEEALGAVSELSIKEFRAKYPRAYGWFYDNDKQWLAANLVKEREKSCWKERDIKYLKIYQDAMQRIMIEGNQQRRITLGYLTDIAGLQYTEVRDYMGRSPKLKAYLDDVLESKEEWLERRLVEIWKRNKGRIAISDVKREMSLKPNTYKKYGNILDAIIKKLNNEEL